MKIARVGKRSLALGVVLAGALALGVALCGALVGCTRTPAKALPEPEYELPTLPPYPPADEGSASDTRAPGLGGAPAFTGAP